MLDAAAYDNPTITARVAALDTAPTAELRTLWRELFGQDAPPFNRGYLVSRLAHRIQEIAFGGLRPETVHRLEQIADEVWGPINGKGRGGKPRRRRPEADRRPIAGTRFMREWQGTLHTATVLDDGYEYDGRRYPSLSAVARAITGTRWNGWTFFGLKAGTARAEEVTT